MPDQPTDLDRPHVFIEGAWTEPRCSRTHRALEAATGEPLATVALGDTLDVSTAVIAARVALEDGPWSHTTPVERAEVMSAFAASLATRAQETSVLVSRETGMPIGMSGAVNGDAPVRLLERYATLARELPFESVRPSRAGATLVRRGPVGVIGAITPWNYALTLAMMKIAPALAAGCTVVLKPSPLGALGSYALADAAVEAGLPPGVLNVVPGEPDAAADLAEGVDRVAVTRFHVANRLTTVDADTELGDRSSWIVCPDADLDALLAGLTGTSMFMSNSQTCTTQARILAPRSRYDEVLDAVVAYARGLVVGNPLDPAVHCGPMASEAHREHFLEWLAYAPDHSNARLVCGGGIPAGADRGWFVEPTVFGDVPYWNDVATKEILGPVLAVIPYDTEDDAVDMVNQRLDCLATSIWTADEERGIALSGRLRAHTVGINYYELDFGAPFGGAKTSGTQRELGPEALEGYLEDQSVYISAAAMERRS